MQAGNWPNPPHADEYAVRFDRGRDRRVLLLSALFDEGNKLRHFTIETMRALDRMGIDTMLPDLPGTNESLSELEQQSLSSWREAAVSASRDFSASHVLALRGGGLCAPADLPTVRYAPVSGESILRGMLRARVLSDREAGQDSTRESLAEQGTNDGLTLAGYRIGADMFRELQAAKADHADIAQGQLGGSALWLRAEPEHDQTQAEALARRVAERIS